MRCPSYTLIESMCVCVSVCVSASVAICAGVCLTVCALQPLRFEDSKHIYYPSSTKAAMGRQQPVAGGIVGNKGIVGNERIVDNAYSALQPLSISFCLSDLCGCGEKSDPALGFSLATTLHSLHFKHWD